ncbi:DUF86 domain-containing protein [Leptospira bourretii]|uniref:HepT-like ribonuclease domain-containing protein n=1 Tax=Leptospira bourretii TaxID=2484962 RepID=UPI001090E947|nr:HepT-like ribonuclease domain-containing protein [Leptospira bourretii]TGL19743.1 DUF86 domain-containing protein [Leptospira bourretii]
MNDIAIIRKYNNDFYNDYEFVNQISDWLKRFAESLAESLEKEPIRLLSKKEFRAATISAFSVLEAETNQIMNTLVNEYPFHKNTYTRIFDFLYSRKYIQLEEYTKLKEYYKIRNKLVHGDSKISKEDATNVVNLIMSILEKIKKN